MGTQSQSSTQRNSNSVPLFFFCLKSDNKFCRPLVQQLDRISELRLKAAKHLRSRNNLNVSECHISSSVYCFSALSQVINSLTNPLKILANLEIQAFYWILNRINHSISGQTYPTNQMKRYFQQNFWLRIQFLSDFSNQIIILSENRFNHFSTQLKCSID